MCLCITSILARAAMTPSIVVKGMTAAIVTRLGCCFFLRVSAVFHKTTGDVVPRIGESTAPGFDVPSLSRKEEEGIKREVIKRDHPYWEVSTGTFDLLTSRDRGRWAHHRE